MRTPSALCLFVLSAAIIAPGGFAAAPTASRASADAFGDSLPEDAIARLGTARFRLTVVWPGSLALSPDGKTISAHSSFSGRSRLALIDSTTGREVRSLPINTAWTNFRFAADGKEIVNASTPDAIIRFYDSTQGKELRAVKMPVARADIFALAADNSVVAAAEQSYGQKAVKVGVCDVKTGKQLCTVESMHNYSVGLALSPDGKYLATFGSFSETGKGDPEARAKIVRTVQLWDTSTGKEYKKLDTAADQVTGVAFSPDKKSLALSTYNEVQVWDLEQGKPLKSWRVPSRTGGLASLVFSPDGKQLVAHGRPGVGNALVVWDLLKDSRVPTARPPDCSLVSVTFCDGRMLALGFRDHALLLWDVLSGKRFDGGDVGHSASVSAVAVRADRVYTAGNDRKVLAWNLSGKLLAAMPDSRGDNRSQFRASAVSSASFATGARLLASTDSNGLTVRAVESGEDLFSYPGGYGGDSAQFSPDGKLLAVTYSGFGVRKWHARVVRCGSGQELLRLEPGTSQPTGLAIDPSGKRLVVVLAAQDAKVPTTVQAWRIDTNKQDEGFEKFEVPGGRRYGTIPMAFSPDGSLLTIAGGYEIYLRDGTTGKERGTIKTGAGVALPPIFSPDGRSLALVTFGNDGLPNASLWEVRTGQKRWEATLPATATALALDPSGVLATAHADTTVLLWDVAGRYRQGKARDAKGWDDLVADLASGSATTAFAAQRAMSADADRAVEALRARIEPAKEKSSDSSETLRAARAVEVLEWSGTVPARKLLADWAAGREGAPLTVEANAALGRHSAR